MNMVKKLAVAAALVVGTLSAGVASADTITFDNLATGFIANGYAGFDWNNFYNTSAPANSGYVGGTVSAPNIAFNAYGNAASFSKATAFSLDNAFFTGAWNDGLQIHVVGTGGGNTFTKDFTVNAVSPTQVFFNWSGITSVSFSSSGGVPHPGYNGAGTHFALDNLTVNAAPVPEPETYAMMLAGLVALSAVARRRKQAKLA
ncbi:MAG: hypothetical protein RL748_3831 [Pseudomonadota bacterium]|jgi:hypothetical protein